MQVVPARRGAIVDRRGVALATSEPADDISATPVPDQGPGPRRGQDRAAARGRRGRARQEARAPRHRIRLPRAPRRPAGRRQRQGARHRGHRLDSGLPPHLPARDARRPGARQRQPRRQGPVRDRVRRRQPAARQSTASASPSTTARDRAIKIHDERTAVAGSTMRLTLDAEIQDRTEEILQQVGREFSPKGASAIVMDPNDGSVLAMANWPRIDSNDLSKTPAWALQNRAVGFAHEPGSTFKAFTVAGALQEGVVQPDTKFNLPPKIQIADRVIGESHDRGWDDARHRRDPRPVEQRRRDQDRPAAARRALRQVGAALRLRQADERRAARRGAGRRRSSSRTTRARRWATSRSARASS